ncbi:digestive organ expansion factor homolog [Trichogramma pretiosum]|uniref:digestive organ expansion factor homolog n=1 Tax=Trichogramma pretiosum TaxID=7493 RepID=UPI0006C96A76|nr:digestive organ expansion factor homolog [Trichogramma pretiosum]
MKPGRGKKFSKKKQEFKPKKKKEKFNYHTSSYIKDRKARYEEIETRRKRIEENKARQNSRKSAVQEVMEVEENPLSDLLKSFGNKIDNAAVDSDSDSSEPVDEGSDNEEDMDEGEENQGNDSVSNSDEDDEDAYDVGKTENSYTENDTADDGENAKQINIVFKDKNEEDDQTEQEDAGHVYDPFSIHLNHDLDSKLYEVLTTTPVSNEIGRLTWPCLGNLQYEIPKTKNEESTCKKEKLTLLNKQTFAASGKPPRLISKVNWNELYVKSMIQNNLLRANSDNLPANVNETSSPLTQLQKELFSVMNQYQDLLYCQRNFNNESQIRYIYCLHAVNHILKTRTKILHHNAKIQKAKLSDMSEIPDEYRDQGLVRPKILILVPFRHSCLKIVELLISIFIGEDKGGSVINKSRFMQDFGGNEISLPKRNPKPEDYELTFKGNTDDTFKIGISITKKALKLYSDFYSSDIIISSILGLRMTIGAEGEEDRDFDFLASIEMLIMDQMEVFLMQNWDHLIHVLDHLHLQPKSSHNTDFARVRSWCVNGWSKYYRQTLMFSSLKLPEINAIFNKRCHNYAGKVRVVNPVLSGTINQVLVPFPQYFQRFDVRNHSKAIDTRFEFFISKILPEFKETIMNHTLIFVPSYFDYVKLRNYFRKEELSFGQICDYTPDSKVARARDMFFHSEKHFLLYTERYHFFRRLKVKGIRHIIFYSPPTFPHFYSEMCNLMQEGYLNPKSGSTSNMKITTIYCKYDALQLSSILGNEMAGKIINANKASKMFMSERI